MISPVQPGITAATGLLVTDLQYEYTHSLLMVLNARRCETSSLRERASTA